MNTPKPEATPGDRELAAEMMLDRPDESRVMPLIAAHVAKAVAEAVAAEKGRRRMEAESYAARAGNDSDPVDGEFVAELMECQNDKEFTRCATRFRLKIERSTAAHVAARLAPVEAERDALSKDRDSWKVMAECLDVKVLREQIDHNKTIDGPLALARAERDALRATVAKMREAILRMMERGQNFGTINEIGEVALQAVPADLADKRLVDAEAYEISKKDCELTGKRTAALAAECESLRAAIRWALGEEGHFAPRPEDAQGVYTKGPYYWRKELRARADAARKEQT